MALRLSAADLERLGAALGALHAPFDYPDLDDWRHDVNRRVRRLTGAHKVVFMLPAPGREPVYSQRLDPAALPPYRDHFHRLDPGPRLGLANGGAPATLEELCGPESLYASEFYNDYLKVWGCDQTLGMAVPIDGASSFAFLSIQRESRSHPPFGSRGAAIMGILWPAFRAGVRAYLALAGHRDALEATLDRIDERILLCDGRGRPLHASAALERTLAADPEAPRLERALRALAVAIGALPRTDRGAEVAAGSTGEREIATARGRYRLYGHRVPASGTPEGMVALHVDPLFREAVPADEIRERWGLTPREVQVARRLAAGRSNAEVAAELGISPHTAKRHTERVLAKLGVASRAQVADRVTRS